ERRGLAADEGAGAPVAVCRPGEAVVAVGIADAEDGDAARPAKRLGGAVADRLAGFRLAHLEDTRLDPHHAPHRVIAAGDRMAAIEGDAGADEVEVIVAAEEDA